MSTIDPSRLSLDAGARVEFGPGALATLPDLLAAEGGHPVLLVTDGGLRSIGVLDRVLAVLGGVEVHCFERVTPNPTTATVDEGAGVARGLGRPVVLGVGGGSALDAAKAIAFAAVPGEGGLLVLAVPTTAGTGAETNGFAVIEDPATRRKVYLGDASVRPRAVVLDPELTLGLPAPITAATGVDALVHGIESLSSRGANPVSVAYATQAVELVSRRLAEAVADGTRLDARAELMLGAHLAGRALTISGLGLVHGFGHAITARLGTPHGVALAAVLEPVLRYSAAAAAGAYTRAGVAMGVTDAIGAAVDLLAAVDLRPRLRDLGATPALLDELAGAALADPVSVNAPLLPAPEQARELLGSVL